MKLKDLPAVVFPGQCPKVIKERKIVRGLSTYSLFHLVRKWRVNGEKRGMSEPQLIVEGILRNNDTVTVQERESIG